MYREEKIKGSMWRLETVLNGSVSEPGIARGMVGIAQRKMRK
jgi:hypothetical protein